MLTQHFFVYFSLEIDIKMISKWYVISLIFPSAVLFFMTHIYGSYLLTAREYLLASSKCLLLVQLLEPMAKNIQLCFLLLQAICEILLTVF